MSKRRGWYRQVYGDGKRGDEHGARKTAPMFGAKYDEDGVLIEGPGMGGGISGDMDAERYYEQETYRYRGPAWYSTAWNRRGDLDVESTLDEYSKTGVWGGYEQYKPLLLEYSYIEQLVGALAAQNKVTCTSGPIWALNLDEKVLTYNPNSLLTETRGKVVSLILHEIGHLTFSETVKKYETDENGTLLGEYPAKLKGDSGRTLKTLLFSPSTKTRATELMNAVEDTRIEALMNKKYPGADLLEYTRQEAEEVLRNLKGMKEAFRAEVAKEVLTKYSLMTLFIENPIGYSRQIRLLEAAASLVGEKVSESITKSPEYNCYGQVIYGSDAFFDQKLYPYAVELTERMAKKLADELVDDENEKNKLAVIYAHGKRNKRWNSLPLSDTGKVAVILREGVRKRVADTLAGVKYDYFDLIGDLVRVNSLGEEVAGPLNRKRHIEPPLAANRTLGVVLALEKGMFSDPDIRPLITCEPEVEAIANAFNGAGMSKTGARGAVKNAMRTIDAMRLPIRDNFAQAGNVTPKAESGNGGMPKRGRGNEDIPIEWRRGEYKSLESSIRSAKQKLISLLRFIRTEDVRKELETRKLRGKLDLKRAYRHRVSDMRLFAKHKAVIDRVGNLAVTLMVDISGSMRGQEMVNATRGALLMCEALDHYDVPTEVIAFNHIAKRLKGFEQPYSDYKEKVAGLANMADGGTSLYPALHATDIQKVPKPKRLAIVVTDGLVGHDDDTRNKVAQMRSGGVSIAMLNIRAGLMPEEMEQMNEESDRIDTPLKKDVNDYAVVNEWTIVDNIARIVSAAAKRKK